MRKIASHFVLSPTGELLKDRVVELSDDGTITGIREVENLDREAGVEFYSGTLVPGFVNAHCHLELSHLKDYIPQGRGFENFYNMMVVSEREDKVGAAQFWDARMWEGGVQAVGDIGNGASTFALKEKSPIFYHSFVEIFGAGADPDGAFRLRDKARKLGLSASVTPHALYSLTPEKFRAAVGDENNRPLSIHFMESEYEVADPAVQLVAQTPKDRPVLLIHNCLATQRDIDIVMGHFTAPVTWVVCPASNRYISNLRPPIELLRKNRLDIAVGTDSLASNTTLSMMHEIALMEDVPLPEVLGWATLGGARALGLDGTLGSIEVGKSPGLVSVSAGKAQRIL